ARPDTAPAYLPVFAAPRPGGPLPRGTRYSFTTDSFALSNAQTLSDLLAHIPGVYVARGGIYGQAEIVLYGGRGPAGLEVFWDGVPHLPLGRDSVYLDPARISLAPLERVDVVVLPATLRIYLVTARQRSTATASQVRIATGQVSTANYRGAYERRWRSGLGLSLVADYNNNDGIVGSSSTAFNSVDLWLKAEYLPSPRVGIAYQIASSSWKRSPSDVAGLTDHFDQKRRDGMLRLFLAARDDGLGPRLELTFATTTAAGDTAVPGRSLSQGALAPGAARGHGAAHRGRLGRAALGSAPRLHRGGAGTARLVRAGRAPRGAQATRRPRPDPSDALSHRARRPRAAARPPRLGLVLRSVRQRRQRLR